MPNNFQYLAQPMAPNIMGAFEQGRVQTRQVQREQYADQQLRAQVDGENRYRDVAGRAAAAATPAERDRLVSEAYGINPQGAMDLQKGFAASDERKQALKVNTARVLTALPMEFRAGAYRKMVPIFREAGLDASDEYTPELDAMMTAFAAGGNQRQAPANIQEWEYYNSLTPEQQRAYLEMKRAQQTFLPEIGGVRTVVRPGVAGGPTTTEQLSSLNAETEAKRALSEAGQQGQADVDLSMRPRIEAATTTAKFEAETNAKALADLPNVEAKSNQIIGLLDRIGSHPGLSGAVGLRSGMELLPATAETDFVALLDQLGGQQFLQAFESLKGGGQITEIEGKKATDAISTLQNRRQSENAYRTAINDLRDVVESARLRAQQRARRAQAAAAPSPTAQPAPVQPPSAPPSASAPVRVTSQQDVERLPSGARFIAPDGVTRVKP